MRPKVFIYRSSTFSYYTLGKFIKIFAPIEAGQLNVTEYQNFDPFCQCVCTVEDNYEINRNFEFMLFVIP